MNPIVLIGRRTAAIEAVRELDYSPIVLEISGRPEQAPHAFGGDLEQGMAMLVDRLDKKRPLAVMGAAEGSVPVAAFISELYGLPGISTRSAFLAHDKLAMKRAIHGAGIPCAAWAEVKLSTTAEELADTLGFPMMLKVPISSGGRGVIPVRNLAALSEAMAPGMLAESFLEGEEMSVESFQFEGRTLLRNHTRYLVPGWASILPADLATEASDAVNALAARVHEALDLNHGITHMELFLTKSGPVFGEIAARPPGGRLMNLLSLAYGFHPWQALVRMALGQEPELPSQSTQFAGAYLLYPKPGVIQAIHGIDKARTMPNVCEVKCHAHPGELIVDRRGTGQTKGHVLVSDTTMAGCEEHLRAAEGAIAFDMQTASAG